MIIEQELREQIARAMSGEVSLRDLYAWLMARSWNMHRDSSPQAIELAANVEALFFQRSSGDISESDLRNELFSLAPVPSFRPWKAANSNVPVKVTLSFDPEPEWPIITSVVQKPRWLAPALAEF